MNVTNEVKITGVYSPCPNCRTVFAGELVDSMSVLNVGEIYYITPHSEACRVLESL